MTTDTDRVGDMTRADLIALIRQVSRQESPLQPYRLGEPTEEWWQRFLASFVRAKPGIPSPTQMLQEERDKWYQP